MSPNSKSPIATYELPRHASAMSWSSKLGPSHFERSAIVYVRQSTANQVLSNRESAVRQHSLADLAVQFGWSPNRVEVIDEDQGHSGATSEGRDGFKRLLSEVGLDHVGIIFGIELSRLARSNKDWHQLIEHALSSERCSQIKMECTTRPTTTTACC